MYARVIGPGHTQRLTSPRLDEQALAARLSLADRKRLGAYYTPVELVDRVLDAVTRYLPGDLPLAFVDPACGAGAFLVRAAERFPHAELFGLELDADSLALARERLPRANLVRGDALEKGTLDTLLSTSRARFEVWVGNPPYHGTSEVLRDAERWRELVAGVPQLRGQSLREDYAFFMLRALERLEGRSGALAFVTSATLLDAWAHAPIRKLLTDRLSLREVHPLGRGMFRDTRVSTCFTVFTTPDLGQGMSTAGPEHLFREVDPRAEELDAQGVRLSELVPISLPGLKTRFDELLVDDDREKLIDRLQRFCAGKRIDVPPECREKLRALPRVEFDERAVRRFLHPNGRRAWCYVDRRLIPRGDHRFQGEWDPHACDVKLVFNHRELPLHAQVIAEPGCVTAYRHSRFAPLMVPERVLREGVAVARYETDLGPLVPNFSRPVANPRAAFDAIAEWINSVPIQQHWAPAFGTSRDLPIVLDAPRV
ncbi:MAG: N-6 DNA methylase [Archangiaceae bacterium]|nr:N-6 DNA methylase [Archangiaceae bacterium]